MMITFLNGSVAASRPRRFALDPGAPEPSLNIRLERGQTVAFGTADTAVEVHVTAGTLWLTQDANDEIIPAGGRFSCSANRRVVVSALAGEAHVAFSIVGDR